MFTPGELQEIIAGARPLAARRTVTFDGGISSGKLSTKAAATTVLSGTNNDIVFTADTAGLAGNAISVEYRNPNVTIARPLIVSASNKAIVVELAVASLTAASLVLTSDNTEVADGATVVLGAITYRFKDTPAQAYDVQRNGTAADTTMGALIKAINATGIAGTDYFAGTLIHPTVSAGALAAHAFTVTAKTAGSAGNLIAAAETSTHLSWAGGAVFLAGGTDAGQIISLASEVKTAIEANAEAAALVDLAYSGADDGSGVVTAMAATSLSGGSDGIVPLFTVHGNCLVALRGYVETTPTGTGGTLVHGKTGTTNDLITILTGTALTAGGGVDSTGYVARGTALAKTPLKAFFDGQTIFATTATHSIDTGKINYIADFIPLTEGAYVAVT